MVASRADIPELAFLQHCWSQSPAIDMTAAGLQWSVPVPLLLYCFAVECLCSLNMVASSADIPELAVHCCVVVMLDVYADTVW